MGEATGKKGKTAPCRAACPAGVDVPRYIRYIREGKFDEALAVIRESIPFPSVCGYACIHPCELKCTRRQWDEPVAIRLLKRAAAENSTGSWSDRLPKVTSTGKKVAVVGAGPCGLTVAYYLAGKGHRVTIFEARALPGGMMRYCIPAYRLPNEVIEREIAVITARGVEIKTNSRVASAQQLLTAGFDAVFVSTGAWAATSTGVKVVGSARVIDGVSFLEQANTGRLPAIGQKVVVVGGGNTAIDAARTALRLGAQHVTLLYRRTRLEMPASQEEIEDALAEGIQLVSLAAPVELADNLLVARRMRLGEKDSSGRPRPVPVPGSEFTLACDLLIEAVGQVAEASAVGLAGRPDGTIAVDPITLATSQPGIFAAGDAVTGPSSIIQAIAQGRQAAVSIDRFLGGDGVIAEKFVDEPEVAAVETAPMGSTRPPVETLPLAERRGGFTPVEQGYDVATAMAEAVRCLDCDLRSYQVEVDFALCKDCGYCQEICDMGVYENSPSYNASGYRPMVAAHPEQCVGCLRCLMICPDFAVRVTQ